MNSLSFEQALERLEALVAELEKGQLTLERSLEAFEEGVRLSRVLTARLEQAEKRARLLSKPGRAARSSCHSMKAATIPTFEIYRARMAPRVDREIRRRLPRPGLAPGVLPDRKSVV